MPRKNPLQALHVVTGGSETDRRGRGDRRRTTGKSGNWCRGRGETEGGSVCRDVVGLTVDTLDVPCVGAHGDRRRLAVANVAIFVRKRAEPSGRKLRVRAHFGELVTGDLGSPLLLRLAQGE